MKVHFICRGNALRSVIAEAYLTSLHLPNVEVISSGIVADKYLSRNVITLSHTINLLRSHGIAKYAKSHPEQLTQKKINSADLNIFMNAIVFEDYLKTYKKPKKYLVWDIVDAGEGKRILKAGQDPYQFDQEIYDDIKAKIDEFAKARNTRLESTINAKSTASDA